MNSRRIFAALVVTIGFISGCQEDREITPNPAASESDELNKDALARQVVDLLNHDASRNKVVSLLESEKVGMRLSDIVNNIEHESRSLKELKTSVGKFEENLSDNSPDKIEIPELWMYNPGKEITKQNLLVAYPPSGDESKWDKAVAYTLSGEIVYLDPFSAPDVPVIVVETSGYEAFKLEIAYVNKILKEEGLQAKRSADLSNNKTAASGLETTMLSKIYLNDDKEPWISGAAEIYAITSGIRNSDNEPEVAVIPMYYLDHDKKYYYPNQIMLFWDDYAYTAANIHLYEKDDNHSYKELTQLIVDGVAEVVGSLSGKTWVAALGEVASAIIEVMPDSWFTNEDDYVDSFYTIEKNKYYYNYDGANGNAMVSLDPYFVNPN